MEGWTRRQFLAQTTIAAAVYTLDPHELCCGVSAYAQTSGADSFELKKVGDGVWAAVAASRYKVNSNAAVIETNDGLVIVDTHSKPSAAQALYKEIQGITKKPVKKVINTHFHWDHWQGNQVYAEGNSGLEIITTERTKARLTDPNQMNGGVGFVDKQIAAMPAEIDKIKAGHRQGAQRRGEGAPGIEPGPGRVLPGPAQGAQAHPADPHGLGHDQAHGGRSRDPAARRRPGAHRRRPVHLPAEGEGAGDG